MPDAAALAEVLDLPEHLQDALWRVESAGIRRFTCTGLSVAVTDGLARGVEALPVPAGDALLAISYSGDENDVVAAFEAATGPRFTLTTGGALGAAARAAKAPVIPLPGGFEQPEWAAGYALGAVQVLAWLGGVGEKPDIDGAAEVVSRLAGEWGGEGAVPQTAPTVDGDALSQAAVSVLWQNLVAVHAG